MFDCHLMWMPAFEPGTLEREPEAAVQREAECGESWMTPAIQRRNGEFGTGNMEKALEAVSEA